MLLLLEAAASPSSSASTASKVLWLCLVMLLMLRLRRPCTEDASTASHSGAAVSDCLTTRPLFSTSLFSTSIATPVTRFERCDLSWWQI